MLGSESNEHFHQFETLRPSFVKCKMSYLYMSYLHTDIKIDLKKTLITPQNTITLVHDHENVWTVYLKKKKTPRKNILLSGGDADRYLHTTSADGRPFK